MGVEQNAQRIITGFPVPILKQIANKRHSHHDKQKSQLNICDINLGARTWIYSLAPVLVINKITQQAIRAIIIAVQTNSIINIPPDKLVFRLFSNLHTAA